MFRYFIILSFLILEIQCFAQNPNGTLYLCVSDGCERIVFNIENKEDSVFYSRDGKFNLKLWYCSLDNYEHYCVPCFGNSLGSTSWSWGRVPHDSIGIYWKFFFAGNIEIEIENLHSNKKMIVTCKEVRESTIVLDIEFREGIFEVSRNFLKLELIDVKE